MPAVIPFIPLIAAGIGAGTAVYSGVQADKRNQTQIGLANQNMQQQQGLIQQLMSGITPQAYQQQAALAGKDAMSQLASDFAQRGMLSSGALGTAGANALTKLQADAAARYQQDRTNAYGMALNARGNMTSQYGQFVNPDPYGGLGQSLGAIGTAAGSYLAGQQPQATGVALPGFGVRSGTTIPGWR